MVLYSLSAIHSLQDADTERSMQLLGQQYKPVGRGESIRAIAENDLDLEDFFFLPNQGRPAESKCLCVF